MAVQNLVETGWDVYHVREGKQILDQAIEAGRQGADAVCDRLAEKAQQLTELREQRDQHNEPVSAILAGACALGAIAYMAWVVSPGGPGIDPGTLFIFGFLLACATLLAIASLSTLPWAAVAA
jgi:hypothetical protein